MTEHRPPDNDPTPSSRALIKRLTAAGTAAGVMAGAAFAYPVVLTFSQEWAHAAAGQRVDYSVASANPTGLQATQIAALLQQKS